MNPKKTDEDRSYLRMDPLWVYHDENIFQRMFEISNKFSELRSNLDTLSEFYEKTESGSPDSITQKDVTDAESAILHLGRCVDVFTYNFPELASKDWFRGFYMDIGHALWRTEERRFSESHQCENSLARFRGEIGDIINNRSSSQHQGITTNLWSFFHKLGDEIDLYSAPDRYLDEVYEARDLFCLSYYSTALLVMGRAVEKALLELGHIRKIKSVEHHNSTYDWDDTSFHYRNVAMYRADFPEKHGKMLSKREYHQIAILVDYRNQVAHSKYSNIDREKALRQLMEAYDLLIDLEGKREFLEGLDEDQIHWITEQNVQ